MNINEKFKELDELVAGRIFDELNDEERTKYLELDKEICSLRALNRKK